ncbi:hypothetical protein MPNT_140032 [Candidatus Methylacidithermus pantelleriae]|uniref:Uncharacterized protein n=1 Tax=Candidatus Methylacidithermus pantelleriae TaxID=2744239 RepID=A0A8J2FNL5_9BACT|nr:hypothetical protein MPNT_140032 [Candidatus Methylacidithermus pantelleriae]
MADALDSGSSGETRAGSSPAERKKTELPVGEKSVPRGRHWISSREAWGFNRSPFGLLGRSSLLLEETSFGMQEPLA